MYQQVRIYPSILQHHLPQLNNTQYTHSKDSDTAVPYAAIWCSNSYGKESPVRPSDPCLWLSSTSDSCPVHRRAEPPSPVQHHMNYHYMDTQSKDQFFQDATAKENFPTAPLDGWRIKFQVDT